MATNHNNEFCVQCETFTYKGDGIRLEHKGSWRTFCTPCGNARQTNKTKAVKKAAYIKQQPTLFPKEVIEMKVEQTFKPLTDKQIEYIRDLFKAKKEFMTIDEQESLIHRMKGHLDGSSQLTAKWGIAAINKLKSYNKERSAS
jgi:uncharacterized Zn finger protein (UPF0148 family)